MKDKKYGIAIIIIAFLVLCCGIFFSFSNSKKKIDDAVSEYKEQVTVLQEELKQQTNENKSKKGSDNDDKVIRNIAEKYAQGFYTITDYNEPAQQRAENVKKYVTSNYYKTLKPSEQGKEQASESEYSSSALINQSYAGDIELNNAEVCIDMTFQTTIDAYKSQRKIFLIVTLTKENNVWLVSAAEENIVGVNP